MKGKELKEILIREGIGLSELSRMLGFANDQRLHSALRAEDVKSGLIEAIAKVTNKSVCFFYTNNAETTSQSVSSSESRIRELEQQRAILTRSLDLINRQLEALLPKQQAE